MRISRFVVALSATGALLAGCVGGSDNDRAEPARSTVAADAVPTTDSTPEPVETLDPEIEPTPEPDATTYEPKEPEPTATAAPLRTHTLDPGLTIIVPVNTVRLTCVHSGRLPSLESTNGNEYPRTVFNAMCASESSGNRVKFTFGQVGANEGVECGTRYYIDGDNPAGIAWWCPKLKMLISSPSAVLESSKNQRLRELTIAYSMGVAQVKYGKAHDTNKIICVMGRTVKNLEDKRKLSAAQADSLKDDLNRIFTDNNAHTLSKLFLKAYATGTC